MYGFFSSEEKAQVRPPREELQQVFIGRKTVAERCVHLYNVVQSASGPGQSRSKPVMDFFDAVPRLVGLIFELNSTSVSTKNSWMRGEHKGITRATIMQLLSLSSSFTAAEQEAAKASGDKGLLTADMQRLRTMFSPGSLTSSLSNSSGGLVSSTGAVVPGYCSLPELLRKQSPSPEAQRTWDQALGGIILSTADDGPTTQFPFPLEYLPVCALDERSSGSNTDSLPRHQYEGCLTRRRLKAFQSYSLLAWRQL